MIRNIVKKIIGDKKEGLLDELTNLKKKEEEFPTSHKKDLDGYFCKRVQGDLLYLPNDKGYRYLLVCVDNYTGITDAVPLKKRDTGTVRKALLKIFYKNKILKQPVIFQVDNGSEFKSGLDEFLKKKGIMLRRGATARHSQQAMVEARNKTFGKTIMQVQLDRELKTGSVDRSWTNLVPIILNEINTVMKNKKVKLPKRTDKVLCVKNKDCDIYSVGDMVRVQLDYPMNYDKKREYGSFRAGDMRYDPTPRRIVNILLFPDRPIRYVVEGKTQTYSKNQLKLVSNKVQFDEKREFEVERIVEEKGNKYLIKWKDYPESSNTWESKAKIQASVPKRVREFERQKKRKEKQKKKEEQEKEYEVEEILDEKRGKYLVKWKGYDSSQNTWEKKSNFANAKAVVRKFIEKRRKNKPTRYSKRLRAKQGV